MSCMQLNVSQMIQNTIREITIMYSVQYNNILNNSEQKQIYVIDQSWIAPHTHMYLCLTGPLFAVGSGYFQYNGPYCNFV